MKKKLSLFLSLLIILSSCLIPSTSVKAATPYLKKLNVKFDLKENTWTTIRRNFPGNVWAKSRVKFKNFKTTKEKDMYHESYDGPVKDNLWFTCDIFIEHPKLSKKEVKKIMHSSYYKKHKVVEADPLIWIYDYNNCTKSLADNGVEFAMIPRPGKYYKYKDSDGCSFKLCDLKIKLIVIYPRKHKNLNLCVGISGNGSYKAPGIEEVRTTPVSNFYRYMWQMRTSDEDLKKHPAYKNDRKYMHFMRIT